MRGISRVLLVSAIGVAAFVAALVSFESAAEAGCVIESQEDPSIEVALEGPFRTDRTRYEFTVTRDGEPLTGARICMVVDMGGGGQMSAMGTSDEAVEQAPGRYEVELRFPMGGFWQGQVLVVEEDRDPAAFEVNFDVER